MDASLNQTTQSMNSHLSASLTNSLKEMLLEWGRSGGSPLILWLLNAPNEGRRFDEAGDVNPEGLEPVCQAKIM